MSRRSWPSAPTPRCPTRPCGRWSAPTVSPIVNHEWWDDATFTPLGTLAAADVARWSEGRLDEDVPIRVNRLVVESDVTLIVGPVLPHEVIGFSGGNKYLFPGLSGQELIDVTHWLGALITSAEIIGTKGITPGAGAGRGGRRPRPR